MKDINYRIRVTKKSFFLRKKDFFGHPFFLFIILSFIHIILLLNIYFDIKYIFLIIFELLFFLYFNSFNFKIIFKIFIISFIIFLLNIFFYEGKIIYNFFLIRITEEGLISGLKKACVLMGTFFFTINILKDKNEKFLINLSNKKKNNIILNAIEYFLIFWKELGENNSIKKLFIKIIRIYKDNEEVKESNIKKKKFVLAKSFYIYHFIIFFIFAFLYFFL